MMSRAGPSGVGVMNSLLPKLPLFQPCEIISSILFLHSERSFGGLQLGQCLPSMLQAQPLCEQLCFSCKHASFSG